MCCLPRSAFRSAGLEQVQGFLVLPAFFWGPLAIVNKAFYGLDCRVIVKSLLHSLLRLGSRRCMDWRRHSKPAPLGQPAALRSFVCKDFRASRAQPRRAEGRAGDGHGQRRAVSHSHKHPETNGNNYDFKQFGPKKLTFIDSTPNLR